MDDSIDEPEEAEDDDERLPEPSPVTLSPERRLEQLQLREEQQRKAALLTIQKRRGAARAIHGHALAALEERVQGHRSLLSRLAVSVSQHITTPEAGTRLTLIGPSGSGKTLIARTLASLANRPFAELAMPDVSQTGWMGPQVSEVLSSQLLHQAKTLAATGAGELSAILHESVVFVDEIDKISFKGCDAQTRTAYSGKQQSLLGLLSGTGKVILEGQSFSTSQMMVVCAGVFDGLRDTPFPMPEDIVELGFHHELVERMGMLHRLSPLRGAQLERVLRSGLEPTLETAKTFGYEIDVSPAALAYAANLVAGGAAGPRSGVSWLRAAAEVGLAQMLSDNAPAGHRRVLTPDDLNVSLRSPARPADHESGEDDEVEESFW